MQGSASYTGCPRKNPPLPRPEKTFRRQGAFFRTFWDCVLIKKGESLPIPEKKTFAPKKRTLTGAFFSGSGIQ